jgi:hypothetical protein
MLSTLTIVSMDQGKLGAAMTESQFYGEARERARTVKVRGRPALAGWLGRLIAAPFAHFSDVAIVTEPAESFGNAGGTLASQPWRSPQPSAHSSLSAAAGR